MPFYKDAGYLVLGSRLKRLSDRLLSDVSKVYDKSGIPFDIGWFPVFFLLREEGPMSVTEIAGRLRVSHPAVVQFVEKLVKHGMVKTTKDKKDGRRRIVSFTPKGKKMLAGIEPVWEAIDESMKQLMLEKVHLRFMLDTLSELENSLDEKGLFDRVKERIDTGR